MDAMQDHYSLSDDEFAKQFRLATLDPQLFNHEAHLRLAFILIKRHGVEEAEDQLCQQIAHFDQTFGDGTKFHKTVTVAAAKAVHHFMGRSSAENFPELLSKFPRLKTNFKDLLACHYGFDVFCHPKAKNTFVEPDLLPFEV